MTTPFPVLVQGRRRSLGQLVALAAVPALAACAQAVPQDVGLALTPSRLTDPAVFNFALKLEYLEAEYYLRGVTGQGLTEADTGPDPGPVNGGRPVRFATRDLAEFAAELAEDERAHVRLLRRTVQGSPLVEMGRPTIDFTGAFAAVARTAGLPAGFDPFADETSFFLGALLFEDLGVTAYNGTSDLVADNGLLETAAGILAAEGYHAGMVRSQLYLLGPEVWRAADAISAARDRLDGPGERDQGVVLAGRANVVPTDGNGVTFSRTPQQVLRIVYGVEQPGMSGGGFYPQGFSGALKTT